MQTLATCSHREKRDRIKSDGIFAQIDSNMKIGEWQFHHELGIGRFATVWMAQTNAQEDAAVKIYRTDHEDYFQNEARIYEHIRKLGGHQNIIACFAIGTIIQFDNTFDPAIPNIHPYLSLEYGIQTVESLVKANKAGRLTVPFVKSIMRDILSGLSFLHGHGLLHSDIKPENFILITDPQNQSGFKAKLGDLGTTTFCKKIFTPVIGTPRYLAPEQLIEEPVTESVDIWALCATCYELVIGKSLFNIHEDKLSDAVMQSKSGASDESISQSDVQSKSSEEADTYERLKMIDFVIGPPPRCFTSTASKYYNERGQLLRDTCFERSSLAEMITAFKKDEIGDSTEAQLNGFHEFLIGGLKYKQNRRFSANTALKHRWLA
jgi:serine/threonine protein kinase